MLPYLFAVLALVLLVVFHELGHFLAARAVGIRATKFYVFFPPAVFKRQVGDVEYGIGAIPAGGFVKLPGMFEPVPGDVAERLRWEYEDLLPAVDGDTRLRLDAARRAVAHADGADELLAPLADIRDALDSVTEPEPIVTKARERIVALLDDVHPRAYWRAALWRRMTVIFAGPFVNLLIAFVVLTAFTWFLIPRYETTGPLVVEQVKKDSPAAEAGLTTDSKIERWNGTVVGKAPRAVGRQIEDSVGKPTKLTWRDEDGDRHTKTIIPRDYKGDGSSEPRIGLLPGLDGDNVAVVGRVTTDPVTGMREAVAQIREVTVGTVTRLPRVFFDNEVRSEVSSVVGIVQVAEDVDQAGRTIEYVALISLVLAVMNLLPLLPLDGGHLLFGLLEAIRRRPMPRAAFERYSMVGLALVMLLFFIGLNNDLTGSSS
jgi:regulator of sigma E protease